MNSPAEADPSGVAGDLADGSTDIEASVDAFYGGRFHLVQPERRGFRAGLDALLLAASIPTSRAGLAADLGAGAGALGLAVAARSPGIDLALVENHPLMAALARRTIALSENRVLAPRLRVVELDVLARRADREGAGLDDGSFSTVVTNPPFHPAGGRGSPDAMRDAARTLPDAGFLEGWLRTGSALLGPSGLLALIARPANLPDILAALRDRLGDIRIVPVHSHPDRPAIRVIVHARKGSRAGLSLLAPVVLHECGGALTPLAQAIGAGDAFVDLGLA